jgi:hypothetical protein
MWGTSVGLVELAPLPFWLEPAATLDVFLVDWCSWTLGMLPKVGCSNNGGEDLGGWMMDGWMVLGRGLG